MIIGWFARLGGVFQGALVAALLSLSFGIQYIVFMEMLDVTWLATAVAGLLIACRLSAAFQARAGQTMLLGTWALRLALLAVALLASFVFFAAKLKSVSTASWAVQMVAILDIACGVHTSEALWLVGGASLLAVSLELAIAVTLGGVIRRLGPLLESYRQIQLQRHLALMQADGELDAARLESVLLRNRVEAAERELQAQLNKLGETSS